MINDITQTSYRHHHSNSIHAVENDVKIKNKISVYLPYPKIVQLPSATFSKHHSWHSVELESWRLARICYKKIPAIFPISSRIPILNKHQLGSLTPGFHSNTVQ